MASYSCTSCSYMHMQVEPGPGVTPPPRVRSTRKRRIAAEAPKAKVQAIGRQSPTEHTNQPLVKEPRALEPISPEGFPNVDLPQVTSEFLTSTQEKDASVCPSDAAAESEERIRRLEATVASCQRTIAQLNVENKSLAKRRHAEA